MEKWKETISLWREIYMCVCVCVDGKEGCNFENYVK